MSKHHLEFKGWGFSVSATGLGIVAAVVTIALLAWVPRRGETRLLLGIDKGFGSRRSEI